MTASEALAATAVIWEPETAQQGTLRASLRVRSPNAIVLAYLHGNGSIVVDNIRLIKGKGGVFRRDFENGIALVNPTIAPVTLPQPDVAGNLARTGVRHISGLQDPVTNNGAPVTTGITLPAADGIVLLANHVAAAVNQTPSAPVATVNGNSAVLTWVGATGTVAGYRLEYGVEGGDLTHIALANARSPQLALSDLEPGTNYQAHVASYDFHGTQSAYSTTATFTTPGTTLQRPQITNAPVLMPGNFVVVSGTQLSSSSSMAGDPPYPTVLAGVQVFVDDIAVPIASAGPTYVMFFIPYNLAGEDATLEIVRNGVSSPARIVPVGTVNAPAMPGASPWLAALIVAFVASATFYRMARKGA